MVEIKEDFKESERQDKMKEFKGLVKKVFGFPFSVSNLGMSVYVDSGIFNIFSNSYPVRIEGNVHWSDVDYEIYVNKEKYVAKAKELAELLESEYQGKKACVIKQLPFK